MKILFIVLVSSSLFFWSLHYSQKKNTDKTQEKLREISVRVVEFDSCEYINYYTQGITHKGNCKFCKDRSLR